MAKLNFALNSPGKRVKQASRKAAARKNEIDTS